MRRQASTLQRHEAASAPPRAASEPQAVASAPPVTTFPSLLPAGWPHLPRRHPFAAGMPPRRSMSRRQQRRQWRLTMGRRRRWSYPSTEMRRRRRLVWSRPLAAPRPQRIVVPVERAMYRRLEAYETMDLRRILWHYSFGLTCSFTVRLCLQRLRCSPGVAQPKGAGGEAGPGVGGLWPVISHGLGWERCRKLVPYR